MLASTLSTFELKNRIIDFNFNTAKYFHPSWQIDCWKQNDAVDVYKKNVLNKPRDRRIDTLLSQRILKHYQLDNQWDFEFFNTNTFKLIALLSLHQQLDIVFQLGLIAFKAKLTLIIDKETQQRLLSYIDDVKYKNMLRYFLDEPLLSEQELPILAMHDEKAFRKSIFNMGFLLLIITFKDCPEPFTQRWLMSWPKRYISFWLNAFYNQQHDIIFERNKELRPQIKQISTHLVMQYFPLVELRNLKTNSMA